MYRLKSKIITPTSTCLILFALVASVILLPSCSSHDTNNQLTSNKIEPYPLPKSFEVKPHIARYYASVCENWFNSYLLSSGFNGSFLVALGGNIIYEKYNGQARLNKNPAINMNTSFHIASVSKTFTAMAVLKLYQEKKLRLDDDFSVYFPALPIPGLTIRCLLNHRSSLPNYVHWMERTDKQVNTISNQDILNQLIRCKDSLIKVIRPNTHFEYCNTNYALLALLIEKITQMSYADYLHHIIFEPAGMNHSFVYTKKLAHQITPSYDWRGIEITNGIMDEVYGDKNIYSTPRDLLIWDRLLSSGLFLQDSLMQQAYTAYSNEKPGMRNYGLGWRMNIYPDGYKFIYHNGWWHGNNAVFIRMLKEQATIIVLGNKFNRNIYKAKYLASAFNKNLPAPAEDEGSE